MRLSAVVIASLVGSALAAQSVDTTLKTPTDSVLARVRQMSRDGRDVEGRRLVDSLFTTMTVDSAHYAEALYLRGSLAATAADAERDYRRLLIEAPVSARAEDALLQLAQLEQARGDRRGASEHLQKYLLSYPNAAARPRVSVQLVRLLFDQGPQQLARACDALRNARFDVPASNVELRNQLDAQAPRCAYVETVAPVAAPTVDSAAAAVSPGITAVNVPPDSLRMAPPVIPSAAQVPPAITPAPTPPATQPAVQPIVAPPASAPAASFYSVQLAAYDSQDAAVRMVQQLAARGIDARVDGAKPPYRVRVGKYQTRADAAKASTDLKGKGHNGFITLVSPTTK